MRIVVFGYHDVGCACLKALIDLRQEVALIVTHADDPGETIWFGSVREMAASHGLTIATPENVNAPAMIERIRALRPDAFLSCYFRQILGPELLAIPPRGAFNMHGSLLPKFRGRAPVNWVLVKGETVTGVTLHHMSEKADRGDIVAQWTVPITDQDTALTLHGKCAAAAGDLIREVWPLIEAGTAPRIPQDPSAASYYGRRRPEDGRIDWSQPARACWNLVRAVTHPYPGAFTFEAGKKLYIWKAEPLDEKAIGAGVTVAGDAAKEIGGEGPIGSAARTSVADADAAAAGAAGTTATSADAAGAGAAGTRATSANAVDAGVSSGTVLAVVPGRGFTVSTGDGAVLVLRAQLEGAEELDGEEMIGKGLVSIGERLDP